SPLCDRLDSCARSCARSGGACFSRTRGLSAAYRATATVWRAHPPALLRHRDSRAAQGLPGRPLMIITRTPFRISFAGGGSDLAAFYSQEPGAVLSAAIDKYMYLTVNERFGNTFRVSYSQTEICERASEIQHPIVRECLAILGMN